MKFLVHFDNDFSLTYNLLDHEIVHEWAKLIVTKTIADCCPNNHYIGYASQSYIEERIQRLYYLAELINSHTPDRIIKQDISGQNWKNALQIMHVHFPDLKNDINYYKIWNELSEYNDIIHWLESTLINPNNNGKYFRITLDFNKNLNTKFLKIPDQAYSLFYPYVNFGQLMLHYTHVGKNAHELLTVNDLTCPEDQFVPQRTFSASVRMYFTDNFHTSTQEKMLYHLRWQRFYNLRGHNFWKHDIDDPKIGFGYIKIGEIADPKPTNQKELSDLRNRLINSKILGWEINGA